MPIAKPAAIEKILYHMANVGNLAPRFNKQGEEVISRSIMAEAAGQQRLPLYSKKFMDDFDAVTGVMNENKLSLVAENLISPEEYRMSLARNPNLGLFYSHPSEKIGYKGGVALPESEMLEAGPIGISHEGRHLEVAKDIFNTGGEQPIFEPSGILTAQTKPGIFEGKSITNLYESDARTVLSAPNLNELDATMSEMGTKAKLNSLDRRELGKYENKEFEAIRKLWWNSLPPKAQKHYIETAALAGIAAPSIGAFQPETKNK